MTPGRRFLGPLIIGLIALFPAGVWLFMEPLGGRFDSLGTAMLSFGQLAALTGMALFSINLILSAKFRVVENLFNGLNRVYIDHHRTGGLAFILLLAHPLFLSLQYLTTSLGAAFSFLVDFDDLDLLLGKIGLITMIIVLGITFYTYWKYEYWKMSHRFMGLAFFLGGLHAFLIESDISENLFLRYYMLGLAGIGLISYIWHSLAKSDQYKEIVFKVDSVKEAAANVTEIKLVPEKQAFSFLPGQFGFIRFMQEGIPVESHPFSLITPLSGGGFNLGIKAVGDFTTAVKNLRTGTSARVEGPHGVFSYLLTESKRQIWMAGGIGITPFLSMARDLNLHGRKEYKIDLFYSVRSSGEATFLDELSEIIKNNPVFSVYPFFSNSQGFISAEFIKKTLGDIEDHDIFLCGPPVFMASLREQFVAKGVPNDKIYSEEFSL
jgi:predicted ferric reductase